MHGTRAVLGQPVPVHLHPDDAVQDEEELVAGLTLFGDHRPGGELADLGLGGAVHQIDRKPALQRRLHLGGERGRVLVAPGAVLAKCPAVPARKVDQAALFDQLVVRAVDPVAGEGAGPEKMVLDRAVHVDLQRQGGPGERRAELYERGPADPAGSGHAGAAPGGLDEEGLLSRHDGGRLEVRERHGLEHGSPVAQAQGR